MRVTKKIKSDLEIIDSLQRITGYKLTKKTKEKSPRMIFLQKVSNNEYNNPIKVQLLKSKNNNQNANYFNMNITSYSSNKPKILVNKNDISYNKIKPKEDLELKNDINKLKASLINTNKNKNKFLDSPKSNTRYKNSTVDIMNQSPIKKGLDLNININNNNSNIKTNNQILSELSKNYAYNKKKPYGHILSPASAFQPSRKNTSDTNSTNKHNNNKNASNNEYGTKTYFGRDNYSVNSFKNGNNLNINSPKTPSYITDIDSKSVKNNLSNNNYNIEIKLEDLILFEERLNDIIIALNQRNYDIGASNECYEFFVFYFNNSSLKYKFPLFFKEENRVIIQSAINLKLYIIMITYHLSLNPNLLLKLLDDLKFIFSLLKQNLYLFIKKLMIFYGEAFILQNEMYFKNFNYILTKNGLNNLDENEIKKLIFKNCTNIVKNISNILNLYKIIGEPFYFDFYEIFCVLSQITEKEINNYFCTYLFKAKKPKKSNNNIVPKKPKIIFYNNILNTDVELYEYKKNRIHPPYITTPSEKKYTLVLDLNNTLINYNENISSNDNIFILRPGLLSFLNTLKPIYELISFTNESKEMSDKYLKEIETNKKYFDFNLYKEHNILIGRNLVKDISKIGRDMKKIIIVDKLYENIKATPHNGILIKPYFGEKDQSDTVLFELKKLLILVHKMGYEDIRTAIKNYESDIKYKITCDNY